MPSFEIEKLALLSAVLTFERLSTAVTPAYALFSPVIASENQVYTTYAGRFLDSATVPFMKIMALRGATGGLHNNAVIQIEEQVFFDFVTGREMRKFIESIVHETLHDMGIGISAGDNLYVRHIDEQNKGFVDYAHDMSGQLVERYGISGLFSPLAETIEINDLWKADGGDKLVPMTVNVGSISLAAENQPVLLTKHPQEAAYLPLEWNVSQIARMFRQ
jgi:hypothetical protein